MVVLFLEAEVFGNLIKRIENKDIKPLVAKIYPLENIVDAQKISKKETYWKDSFFNIILKI